MVVNVAAHSVRADRKTDNEARNEKPTQKGNKEREKKLKLIREGHRLTNIVTVLL